ncbi:MAG: hydrolase, partial [Acinetobacter sp.]|nr:hydrolase [Acinetobacter sp.]
MMMQILMIAGWGGVMNAMQPLQQHLHQLGHQVDLLDFFSPHDDVWHDVLKQLSHYHMVVGWSLGGQLATLLAHEAQQQGV